MRHQSISCGRKCNSQTQHILLFFFFLVMFSLLASDHMLTRKLAQLEEMPCLREMKSYQSFHTTKM